MLDHAFQRREIERMLLSGKRLTVPKLIKRKVGNIQSASVRGRPGRY